MKTADPEAILEATDLNLYRAILIPLETLARQIALLAIAVVPDS